MPDQDITSTAPVRQDDPDVVERIIMRAAIDIANRVSPSGDRDERDPANMNALRIAQEEVRKALAALSKPSPEQCCGEYVAGSRCPACPDRPSPTPVDREDIEGLVELPSGARKSAICEAIAAAHIVARRAWKGSEAYNDAMLVAEQIAALQSPEKPVQGDRGELAEQSGWLEHQTGSSLVFDDGILNLSRNGSATLVFRDEVLEWETNDETGKEYRYATLPASEVRAIQDELNKRFPPALTADAALIARLQERVDELTEGLRGGDGPDLGSSAGAEPPIREIVYAYYSAHFDADRAGELTKSYLDALLKEQGQGERR